MVIAMDADVIVVGGGLAGLVATAELADAGRTVLLLDQENEANLGGQAWWSFGGLFFVDSPEQQRMRIKDSVELAHQDWLGTAGFDRDREDHWPRQWAEAYVNFAAGEKRAWLAEQGVKIFPFVGWAERGGYGPQGHGNSVPRFHITWGTGPGFVKPFADRVKAAADRGLVTFGFRHQVDELIVEGGAVTGVRGSVLAPSRTARGMASSREVVGQFERTAQAVIVTSGGIGANHDLVRQNWPARLGTPPTSMVTGVPAHVDGRMLGITEAAGGSIVNRDRMWHYVEGLKNHSPVWPGHGIRIIPGPSSLWLDATGTPLPGPLFPGFDTLGTLEHIMRTGHEHTWFVLDDQIIEREFTLSGSEQNPDLTDKSIRKLLKRIAPGPTAPVQAFLDHGEDFVTATSVSELVGKMNALHGGEALLDAGAVERVIRARDRELVNPYTKDAQLTAIAGARRYKPDRIMRIAKPHQLLAAPGEEQGRLIAVKLHILTRKTLGGLETDLGSRVLAQSGAPDVVGEPLPGLYAAGEVAGFGGGGVHGYRALEGTFLGGCLFSGRAAGRTAAADIA